MKKFLHISSDTPGIVTINDECVIIGNKKVHIALDSSCYVSFNPNDASLKTINLNLPTENSDIVQVIPFCGGHYDINIKDTLTNTDNEITSKTFGKLGIVVTGNNYCYKVKILLEDQTKISFFTPKLSNLKVTTNSFIVIQGDNDNRPYFAIVDENFNVIINSFAVDYEQDNRKLKILIDLNDIMGLGKVYEFDTDGNTTNSYLVYMKNNFQAPTDYRLIPMAMLQALRAGSEKLCTSYFENQTDITKIKDYFGNVREFYFNVYELDKVNYTVIADTINSYDFTIENNKIVDIEEVEIII